MSGIGALLVVARSYGFASWPKLRATLDAIDRFSRSPHRDTSGGFLTLACLTYSDDDPARRARARRMLSERPDLAGESIFTAAAVGDVAAAQRLLERGADPAAGFLWDGLTSPFTVLTGAFGGGEGGQPPHRDEPALAELLLEAGADPNDSQTLYNRGLRQGEDSYLRLLLRHGLGRGDGGVWHRRLGPTHPTPTQLLQDELIKAARHNAVDRVGLLLEHGADPAGVGTAHPVFDGFNARQVSMVYGHTGLLPHDADPVLGFLGACMRGEFVDDPALAAAAIARRPHHLVAAAGEGRTGAVRLMAGLGFAFTETDALHQAAFNGHLDTVRALVELGADPDRRDASFGATARGWAEHNRQWAAAGYLAGVERSR